MFESQNVQVIEKRAAGIFSVAGEDALNQARMDQELWELLLRQEIAFSKDPSYLTFGASTICGGFAKAKCLYMAVCWHEFAHNGRKMLQTSTIGYLNCGANLIYVVKKL